MISGVFFKRLETDSSIKLFFFIFKNLKGQLVKVFSLYLDSKEANFFFFMQVEVFAETRNSCVVTPASIIWLLWKIIYVFLCDSKARGWLNYCKKFSVWHFRNSTATVFKSWHLHNMKLFRALLWVQGRYHIKSWWHAEIVKWKCVSYKSVFRSILQA